MPRIPWNASQITAAKTLVKRHATRTTYSFEGVRNLQLDALADGRRIWRVRYRIHLGGEPIPFDVCPLETVPTARIKPRNSVKF